MNDLGHHVERVAAQLELAAERFRRKIDLFQDDSRDATTDAAEVVQEFVQLGGSIGPILWQLVADAGTEQVQRMTQARKAD